MVAVPDEHEVDYGNNIIIKWDAVHDRYNNLFDRELMAVVVAILYWTI